METRIILTVGSILLFCGFAGLLIVRLTNPFLKGLGWLGGTFAVGSLGATIFALSADIFATSTVLMADTLILLAFVLLHVCLLELTEGKSRMPTLGIALLGIQGAAYLVFRSLHEVRQLGTATLGVLVAIQAIQSARALRKDVKAGMHAPVWLSTALLTSFAAFNLFRSAVILVLGTPLDPRLPNPLEAPTAMVFLGTGLGIGFGVFWMTSAQIRITLEQLANTDPLTGINNRRCFVGWCERELLRSSRSGENFSIIMLDLDHFKQINDSHGHSIGDAALCAVVQRLKDSVRNVDVLGRWGGEEFVALLPGANSAAAMHVAQRMRRSVESLSLLNPRTANGDGSQAIAVTISIGVATYLGPPDTIDGLFERCDQAMYRAKADGRNRVVFTGA